MSKARIPLLMQCSMTKPSASAKLSLGLFALAILVLHCGICLGQQAPQWLEVWDRAIKKEGLREPRASELFQGLRRNLGENFEAQLWNYLSDDIDRQSRVASLLVYPGFLHDSLPMPNLARKINLKTLSLLAGKSDRSSRTAFVTAAVNVAVESAELEYRGEAERRKRDVQQMLASDRSLVAGLPAMTDYENCVYDLIGNPEIPSPARACLANKTPDDPRVTEIDLGEIDADWVISKPEPRWPHEVKTGAVPPGAIKVKVLINENGRLDTAAATGGPHSLTQPALTAVSRTRFKKTIYQGNPVKAWGWLTYSY